MKEWRLSPDRYFDPDPTQRAHARAFYEQVKDLPIVSPHGHVDPRLLADPDARFGSPAELFIIPDHYVTRMLVSQGVGFEDLGIPARDGTPVETDHQKIWQRFAERFSLFRATPAGLWFREELAAVFGITEELSGGNAQRIYDEIVARLAEPAFRPRTLFQRFKIEVLCTTDAATDDLTTHAALKQQGWGGKVRPTFRPDAVTNLATPQWRAHIERMGEVSGVAVTNYRSYIETFEHQRARFAELGAVATDHAVVEPYTAHLTDREASAIFDRALRGKLEDDDVRRFTAHMLMEMARMSTDDRLVMQIHAGSLRDHDPALFARFGPDKGADIPVSVEWTRNLKALLNAYGHHPNFRLVLFTLDETNYSRELAPLAGYYPAVYLGAPWWFHDSPSGIRRYLDQVVETAGIQNLAGFTDDTRAFLSIPTRHDLWRRVTCDWLAGLVVRGIVREDDAREMAQDLAHNLAKRAYKLV